VDARRRFAQNLREQRAQRGWSQEARGAASGLHRTEISMLERTERDPRLSTIVRVANALEIPPMELLRGIA
jgi:transcriptional regulator with XRE-family HTH domain